MKIINFCLIFFTGFFLLPIGTCERVVTTNYGDKVEFGREGGEIKLCGDVELLSLNIKDNNGNNGYARPPVPPSKDTIIERDWGLDTLITDDWYGIEIPCEYDWLKVIHSPYDKTLIIIAEQNNTGKKRKLYIENNFGDYTILEIPVIQRGK